RRMVLPSPPRRPLPLAWPVFHLQPDDLAFSPVQAAARRPRGPSHGASWRRLILINPPALFGPLRRNDRPGPSLHLAAGNPAAASPCSRPMGHEITAPQKNKTSRCHGRRSLPRRG